MKDQAINFKIGEIAFLRTDIDQRERLVTAILIRPAGVMYELSFGSENSYHYDFEISKKRDTLKSLS